MPKTPRAERGVSVEVTLGDVALVFVEADDGEEIIVLRGPDGAAVGLKRAQFDAIVAAVQGN